MNSSSAARACSGKSSPSRAGLSLRLEDPYVTAHLPDDGLDLASSIDEDGRFSFVDIAGRVSVGMAALLTDPRPTRLSLPSETFLFEGGPQTVSDAAAYMLPADFAAALAAATSIADLAQRGFLLGVVLDAGGHPVSGATIEGYGLEPSRLLYLGEDLVPVAGGVATGTSGAFLVAGPLELMNFTVEGLEGYPRRKGLVRPGLAFLIVFQP